MDRWLGKTWLIMGFLLGGSTGRAGELAEVGVAANEATVQGIRTYYAETTLNVNIKAGRPSTTIRSSFWKTEGETRLREVQESGKVVDVRYAENTMEISARGVPGSKNEPPGIRIESKNYRVSEANPWQLSLLTLPVGVSAKEPLTIYSLAEAFRQFRLDEERWVDQDGERLLRLHLASESEGREYTVDLSKRWNWMIVRCTHVVHPKRNAGDIRVEVATRDFAEVRPGFFLPRRATVATTHGGFPTIVHEVEFANLRINDSGIKPPRFEVPSQGAMVLDNTKGIYYKENANGERVSKLGKIGEPLRIVANAPPQAPPGTSDGRRVVWLAMCLIGALGVGIGLRQRWRRTGAPVGRDEA